jgi:hypothetical protein
VTGWLLLALSQAAIAAGGWLLSRHIGWEATVAVLLIVEGGIGALYGTLTAGKGPVPWHGGAIDRQDGIG